MIVTIFYHSVGHYITAHGQCKHTVLVECQFCHTCHFCGDLPWSVHHDSWYEVIYEVYFYRMILVVSEWVCRVWRPTRHTIGHFRDDFYRSDDQTNSVKALKETSWSSKIGLNLTRTTPPCYNNTTLGNRLYAQRKGPNVINPICWTCKNWSHKCAADCEHCVTQSSTELFW